MRISRALYGLESNTCRPSSKKPLFTFSVLHNSYSIEVTISHSDLITFKYLLCQLSVYGTNLRTNYHNRRAACVSDLHKYFMDCDD